MKYDQIMAQILLELNANFAKPSKPGINLQRRNSCVRKRYVGNLILQVLPIWEVYGSDKLDDQKTTVSIIEPAAVE